MCDASTIRVTIRDQVALCSYVADLDAKTINGNTGTPCPSYRVAQWKQRHAETLQLPPEERGSTREMQSEIHTATQDTECHLVEKNEQILEHLSDERLIEPEQTFEQFLSQVASNDIRFCDLNVLESIPTDRLGVTSVPSKREGNSLTLCCVNGVKQIIVFGGRIAKDVTKLLTQASQIDNFNLERVRYAFSNSVYSYVLDTAQWSLKQCSGRLPRERSDHSAVKLTNNHIAIFGGRGANGCMFNDFFVISLQNWQWYQIDTQTRPSVRYWHASCHADRQVWIFGGRDDVNIHSDLQKLDSDGLERLLGNYETFQQENNHADHQQFKLIYPLAWTRPTTVGRPPKACFGMRMVSLGNDQIALIGGWGDDRKLKENSSMRCFVLDTITLVWTSPRSPSHLCGFSVPSKRFNFNCYDAFNTVIIYGGFRYVNGESEEYTTVDDNRLVYTLDIPRMIWRCYQLPIAVERTKIISVHHFGSAFVDIDQNGVAKAYSCTVRDGTSNLSISCLTINRVLN